MKPSTDRAPAAPRTAEPLDVLGAILAGGLSRRFGSAKALAPVGGRPLAQRVADAVAAVVGHPVVITGDSSLPALLGLPSRRDVVAGVGPLGGLHTALLWAREMELPGALCVACDLPFVSARLLRTTAEIGLDAGVSVVPESPSRRGFEPLCAWYAVSAIPEVERAIESDRASLHLLWDRLPMRRIPLREVSRHGDPAVMFMNVNTPEAALAAERSLMANRTTSDPLVPHGPTESRSLREPRDAR